jgi:GTPase
MHVDETFNPKGIGLVIGGFLKKGIIKVNQDYLIGPIDGCYESIRCRSLHVNKTPVQEAPPGRYICMAVSKLDRRKIRRGMVILSDKKMCKSVTSFTAEIIVYRTHHTTIRIGYESVIHINSLRTTVKLAKIIEKKKIKLRKSREVINEEESDDNVLSLGMHC